ncbi:MAG TPA: methylated-DNA--[protein]-cysteine S-methyltransferase [Micromonosporaceae bacterium]|nr:methylated-DNA--[protein]-cysteine S-methyltransferase [Micromonosporaceae bacterium]
MTTHYSTLDTPVGPFTIVAAADGAVLASGFTADVPALLALVHLSLHETGLAGPQHRADLGPATKAVLGYLDGDLATLDAVPVRQHNGGAFLGHAWDVLRTVPAGAPVSYTQFAALAGRPAAVRGAAQACARNAAALFVPCHRVLRGDSTLGGYRWGTPVKRWLLDHEARMVHQSG